ncbi:MAG: glucokinase [Pseudomonadota bacterium]
MPTFGAKAIPDSNRPASTWLIADIGGTHARFARLSAGDLQETIVLETQSCENAIELLHTALAHLGIGSPSAVLLAVAGPLTPTGITMTKTGLSFVPDTLAAALGVEVHVVNDFYALAHGVGRFSQLVNLGEQAPEAGGVCGVIGPGSGLGMASVVSGDRGLVVLGGEGGHAALAPGTHLEAELWALLSSQVEHVCWETVLCGPGLVTLYNAVCQVWGGAPRYERAEDISAQAVGVADPVCHQTLETFCALLGQAAKGLALTVGATGGIYIAGGIAPRVVDFVAASPFRRRFEEAGAMRGYLQIVPTYVVCDANPGLIGAAQCLAQRATID